MKIPKADGTTKPELKKLSDNWQDVICDKCGKSCRDSMGMNFEYAEIEACWGFASKKDLEHHTAQVCEACYDAIGLKPQVKVHLFGSRDQADPKL